MSEAFSDFDYYELGQKHSEEEMTISCPKCAGKDAEIARLRTMSTVEMMCENPNVDNHVRACEARAEACVNEVKRLRALVDVGREMADENIKLGQLADARARWRTLEGELEKMKSGGAW